MRTWVFTSNVIFTITIENPVINKTMVMFNLSIWVFNTCKIKLMSFCKYRTRTFIILEREVRVRSFCYLIDKLDTSNTISNFTICFTSNIINIIDTTEIILKNVNVVIYNNSNIIISGSKVS